MKFWASVAIGVNVNISLLKGKEFWHILSIDTFEDTFEQSESYNGLYIVKRLQRLIRDSSSNWLWFIRGLAFIRSRTTFWSVTIVESLPVYGLSLSDWRLNLNCLIQYWSATSKCDQMQGCISCSRFSHIIPSHSYFTIYGIVLR